MVGNSLFPLIIRYNQPSCPLDHISFIHYVKGKFTDTLVCLVSAVTAALSPLIHWFLLRQRGWDRGVTDGYITVMMWARRSLVSWVPQHDSLLLIADSLCHGFPPAQLPTFFHFVDPLEQHLDSPKAKLPFFVCFKWNVSHSVHTSRMNISENCKSWRRVIWLKKWLKTGETCQEMGVNSSRFPKN